jgi:hypothetical protein
VSGDYTRATYLKEVRWSGNAANGQTLPPRMKATFTREARPDNHLTATPNGCEQSLYGSQRLSFIETKVQTPSGAWHLLNRTVLSYTLTATIGNTNHSLLNSISIYGEGANDLLYSYDFEYNAGVGIVSLKGVVRNQAKGQ